MADKGIAYPHPCDLNRQLNQCISPNPSTPIQTAVITAPKTSTISGHTVDITFPPS